MLLRATEDVDDFVANCPPTEINADACVLGLYDTADTAGRTAYFFVSFLISGNFK